MRVFAHREKAGAQCIPFPLVDAPRVDTLVNCYYRRVRGCLDSFDVVLRIWRVTLSGMGTPCTNASSTLNLWVPLVQFCPGIVDVPRRILELAWGADPKI
jgi:hypothetical protein